MKLKKQTILFLAAEWNKDPRSIKRWLKKKDHPMITHPISQKIIKEYEK